MARVFKRGWRRGCGNTGFHCVLGLIYILYGNSRKLFKTKQDKGYSDEYLSIIFKGNDLKVCNHSGEWSKSIEIIVIDIY